jgi:hypothetical protein
LVSNLIAVPSCDEPAFLVNDDGLTDVNPS